MKNLFPDEDNGSPSSINAPIDEHSDSDSGSSVKGNSEDKGSNGGSSMEVGGGTPKFDDEDEEDDYVLASLLEKDSKRKKERVLTFDDMWFFVIWSWYKISTDFYIPVLFVLYSFWLALKTYLVWIFYLIISCDLLKALFNLIAFFFPLRV